MDRSIVVSFTLGELEALNANAKILLLAHRRAYGEVPIPRVAAFWGCSERGLRGAHSTLKELSRDLDLGSGSTHEGARHEVSEPEPHPDPLVEEIRREGVWSVDAVERALAEHGREKVEIQLAYYRHLEADGYTFPRGKASWLYNAVRYPDRFRPSERFLAKHRQATVIEEASGRAYNTPEHVDKAKALPEAIKAETLTPEAKLEALRTMARNPMAIRSAMKRAQEWGIPWEQVTEPVSA